jgi:hypothetical protein
MAPKPRAPPPSHLHVWNPFPADRLDSPGHGGFLHESRRTSDDAGGAFVTQLGHAALLVQVSRPLGQSTIVASLASSYNFLKLSRAAARPADVWRFACEHT